MATEEQKPVVAPEAGAVEPTPVAPVVADKPIEAVEPKVEETPKTEGEVVAPAEEVKEEKKEEKKDEPIYSGALGYKAPGLKNAFRFSKKYFWFGEEEPVPVQSLSQYLRGEKAEVAHPTAAWSSQTGKGLLFFVKHADQKETPAGVLNLSEATDLSKDGTVAFYFKLHGHKHTFEAQTLPERNGWFVAFESVIEEAKASKETIHAKESYKEELAKLGKPAALAATAASAPKKSTDATPKPAETETPVVGEASTPAPARAGSSSSSSSDEEKKKKKKAAKSKSRSVSRGKRASIFGGFLGKKEKAEEKAEEKKEEKEEKKEEAEAEKKAEETPVVAAPVAEASTTTAPVIPPVETELPKATEEPKTEEAAAPVTEEKKAEEKPKPTKRGSIFGTFVEKLKSPTHEKKEHEVGPPPPAKEPEVAKEETPKAEETPAPVAPVVPVTDATTETPKTEEAKPAVTPAKEKQHFSFGKFLGGAKEKVRSPSGEKAPEAAKTEETPKTTEEAPKLEEVPAVAPIAPIEPAAEAPKEEEKKEETPAAATTTTTATTTPKEKAKRGSIFGNLTGSVKKEGDSEKPQGLKGLFRNASKAGRSKKEKETTATPAKVEETTEPKEEKTEETPKVEEKTETPVAPAEPAAIGDVVPEAVTVGQAPKSTPQVSTTA